jgi:copper oxidase (laccase) domain-containing protein
MAEINGNHFMIKADQPQCFNNTVIAALSSTSDGDMRFSGGDSVQTTDNRNSFLKQVGISLEQTTRVQITYNDGEHFARYHIVREEDKGEGMLGHPSSLVADALIVRSPGHALFLLIADCVGVIIHDPVHNVLMVSHIGRHSAEILGARKSIEFLQSECESNPSELIVWLSPAAGKSSYPLYAMDGRGLREVIKEQLQKAGVSEGNITASLIDTTVCENYFSHSRFLTGNYKQEDGRFAIVTMLKS